MRRKLRWLHYSVGIGAFLLAVFPCGAQEQPASSSSVSVSTVVTVLGPKYTPPRALSKDDILVHEGQARKDILDWVPAQGDRAGLELAIVIDESTRKSLGKQFDDLADFINSLPQSASVGIFYASNGTVSAASQFGPDHEAAANALRLPIGSTQAYSSIYNSVMDLISRWPVSNARREILLLSDGLDRLQGGQNGPNVRSAIEKTQQAGIIIHAIFVSGIGVAGRRQSGAVTGQGNLNALVEGSGGKAFFQGFATPISFQPFLAQLDVVLRNQYFLAWTTQRSKNAKGELRSFKVTTEQRGVEITAAPKIFVPAEK